MIAKEHAHTSPMFHYFRMEDLVPEDHILRRIDAAVDFSFVRSAVRHCYCPDNGRPGADPELIVRMLVIGYLYDLSENQLCQDVRMHAAYRLFCHLTFEDAVPDRSTLNKLRNHKWASSGLFERLMQHIVHQCIEAGLVKGQHLSVDGTQIRAHASVKSIEPIAPAVSLDAYLTGLGLQAPEGPVPDAAAHPQEKDFHGARWTNATHRSTTDPEARLYRKSSGQEASLSFLGHQLIDTHSRVILATKATPATGTAEREAALAMLDTLPGSVLSHEPPILAADTGYGASDFLAAVVDRGVIPHIPLLADPALEPIPTWQRRTKNVHRQAHRAKKVREAHARNYVRSLAATPQFPRSQHLRKRNEHLFAEAKEQHGMRRARHRGVRALQEQLYLTATVQNLKRLVAFLKKKKATIEAQCAQQAPGHSIDTTGVTVWKALIEFIAPVWTLPQHFSSPLEHSLACYVTPQMQTISQVF